MSSPAVATTAVRPEWVERSALVVLILVGVSLESRPYRPLWFDEMLQFAFGGYADTGSAWAAIRQSLTWINHNQTGVYFLVDFWLLKIFGASPFALRLPSLLSTAFLLFSVLVFGENRRLSLLWKLALVVGIFAQDSLMIFAAEARPYMPLAAASVGVLAFYSAPIARRGRGTMLLGAAAVLLGTLFHPYFPVYWVTILGFFYGLAVVEGDCPLGLRSAVRFADLRLVVMGVVVFFTIAELSWLSVSVPQNLDPFQFIPRDQFLQQFIDATHFVFIANPYNWLVLDPRRAVPLLMVLVAAILLIVPGRGRALAPALVPPVVLMLLALAVSLFFSWVSYRNHYWIMARQWIASWPLIVIAVVWFCAEAGRQLSVFWRWSGPVLALVALCSFLDEIHMIFPDRVAELAPAAHDPAAAIPREPSPDEPKPKTEAAWVDLANENVQAGGPVWTVFQRLYGGK
jgi:hypothetical protein